MAVTLPKAEWAADPGSADAIFFLFHLHRLRKPELFRDFALKNSIFTRFSSAIGPPSHPGTLLFITQVVAASVRYVISGVLSVTAGAGRGQMCCSLGHTTRAKRSVTTNSSTPCKGSPLPTAAPDTGGGNAASSQLWSDPPLQFHDLYLFLSVLQVQSVLQCVQCQVTGSNADVDD